MKHFVRPWKIVHRERIKQLIAGELFLILLNIVCYRDWRWMIPTQILLYPFIREWNKREKSVLQMKYARGFQMLLQSLTTSIQAGYTLENSCRAALAEFTDQYGEKNNPTVLQLRKIVHGMELGIPIEDLFMSYAKETQNEDILHFAAVMDIVKGTGGNLVVILKNTMDNFQKKTDTEEEIRVILSGMIYEKNIMLCMPILILSYMRLTNGEYMSYLYDSPAGHILVSIVIAVIIGCYYWTESMTDRKV